MDKLFFTDFELAKKVQAGDVLAFTELFLRHQKKLLRIAKKFMKDWSLAEDIVQEVFEKAFIKMKSYRAEASFFSWLKVITVNTAQNRLRSQKRHVDIDDSFDISGDYEHENNAVHKIDLKIWSKIFHDKIKMLPPQQKLSLVLRIYHDLDFAEIAKKMQCPYDTAKANYRNGLLKLKKLCLIPFNDAGS